MPGDPITSPHDRLFKETFSRAEAARGFFEAYLPEPLARACDWESLRLEPGSFVDEKLREHCSDLLYSVRFQGSALYLYCLAEHFSTPEPSTPLRLLRYQTSIWEQVMRSEPGAKKLPPILPLVLYQGGPLWNVPKR